MKKKEKKEILTLLIVGVIIIAVVVICVNLIKKNKDENAGETENTEKYVQVLEDGTKLNVSNKLKEVKKLDGLEISNIQLTYRNGVAEVLADVVNTTNKDVPLTPVILTLYDEKNNIIDKLDGLISPVKAGGSVQLHIGVSTDYANAYDFSIVKK